MEKGNWYDGEEMKGSIWILDSQSQCDLDLCSISLLCFSLFQVIFYTTNPQITALDAMEIFVNIEFVVEQ
jgi:hypothetical protein